MSAKMAAREKDESSVERRDAAGASSMKEEKE